MDKGDDEAEKKKKPYRGWEVVMQGDKEGSRLKSWLGGCWRGGEGSHQGFTKKSAEGTLMREKGPRGSGALKPFSWPLTSKGANQRPFKGNPEKERDSTGGSCWTGRESGKRGTK